MNTIIKIVRSVITSNLIILGLAACSSSPAPWTQQNDSPWGAKHAAEAANVPDDEVAMSEDSSDPVMLDETAPEPIVMQEPVVTEPEPEPVPVVVAPVVVEDKVALTPEEEVLVIPEGSYAIQVYASKTMSSVDKFIADNDLYNLMVVKTDRSGSIVYVVVDIYPDRSTANAAAVELEAKIGSKPWVRSIAGLQKIVAQ